MASTSKNRIKHKCCIATCRNSKQVLPGTHLFHVTAERAKKWNIGLKSTSIGKRICENHFKAEDFCCSVVTERNRRRTRCNVKRGAQPTIRWQKSISCVKKGCGGGHLNSEDSNETTLEDDANSSESFAEVLEIDPLEVPPVETLQNVPVLETNGMKTSETSTNAHNTRTYERELQGNVEGAKDFDMKSAFLAVQGKSLDFPLSVSFEYLDAEEAKLREHARDLKAAEMSLTTRRNKIATERECLEEKLKIRQADSTAKCDALDATAKEVTSKLLEIQAIKDKESQLASDISKANIEQLQMRLALAELEAEIRRSQIECAKNSVLSGSLMGNITKKQAVFKEVEQNISKHETLMAELRDALRETTSRLQRYSDEECILRGREKLKKMEHQASLALANSTQWELAAATTVLLILEDKCKCNALERTSLESNLTKILSCRQRKQQNKFL